MSQIELAVTAEADTVKRALGSIASVVLEHLVLTADAELRSRATARSVAHAVSVSKDTAAAAVRRLESAGLVERLAQGRSRGQFVAAGYRLILPPGLTVSTADHRPTTRSVPRRPRARTSPPPDGTQVEQLVLLAESPPSTVDQLERTHALSRPERRVVHEFASSDAAAGVERAGKAGGKRC